MWFDRVKLESNTTPTFLTLVLVRPDYQGYWLFLEPMKINSVFSGLSLNLFEFICEHEIWNAI